MYSNIPENVVSLFVINTLALIYSRHTAIFYAMSLGTSLQFQLSPKKENICWNAVTVNLTIPKIKYIEHIVHGIHYSKKNRRFQLFILPQLKYLVLHRKVNIYNLIYRRHTRPSDLLGIQTLVKINHN